jgi:hypothetical protein
MNMGREVEGDEVGAEGGVCFLQGLEPRLRAEGEENTLDTTIVYSDSLLIQSFSKIGYP